MQTNPEDEKDDPVWKLLDRARPVKPSPFFSRNVVREVRQLRDGGGTAWWTRLLRPAAANVAIPALATLAVAALALFLLNHQGQVGDNSGGPGAVVQVAAGGVTQEPAPAMEFDPAAEIGNLEYLGQLMAVTDPGALDDSALADLLF